MGERFDFDAVIDRRGTDCETWDSPEVSARDLLPLSIAELDFEAPACVQQALLSRINRPVFGYSRPATGLFEAFSQWMVAHHALQVPPTSVAWTASTIGAVVAALELWSPPASRVIVPVPIYPPLLQAARVAGREVVTLPFRVERPTDPIDWDRLEALAASGAGALLWCNPHNPTGRVWRADELARIVEITRKYRLLLVSDEVHADFVYEPAQTPFHSLQTFAEPDLKLVVAFSSSKTFSLPGMGLSAIALSPQTDRATFERYFDTRHWKALNPLSMWAHRAGWLGAGPWHQALLAYLAENRKLLFHGLQALDLCEPVWPEATPVMWVKLHTAKLAGLTARAFFEDEARVRPRWGCGFGPPEGEWLRLNFGVRRALLTQAVQRLGDATRRLS